MASNEGHPEVEDCGICRKPKSRLDSGALVCAKCDMIPGKVPA